MKRPVRDPKNGTYKIKGKKYKELFGSREQVWNGTAYKTSGGLTRDKLHYNKRGRVVSKKKYNTALNISKIFQKNQKEYSVFLLGFIQLL